MLCYFCSSLSFSQLLPVVLTLVFLLFQGFSSDSSFFVVFFICFFLQVIELILCCFSDQRATQTTYYTQVLQYTHTHKITVRSALWLTSDLFYRYVISLISLFRTIVQPKMPHFSQSSSSSGLAGKTTHHHNSCFGLHTSLYLFGTFFYLFIYITVKSYI